MWGLATVVDVFGFGFAHFEAAGGGLAKPMTSSGRAIANMVGKKRGEEGKTHQQRHNKVMMAKKIRTAMRMNFPTRWKKEDCFLQTRWPLLSVVHVYLIHCQYSNCKTRVLRRRT